MKDNFVNVKRNKKIGVFLPIHYRGGTLNAAKNIAKMLYLGSRNAGEPVDVVFSYVDGYYDIQEDFGDLLELGIGLRSTIWEIISEEQLEIFKIFTKTESPADFSLSPKSYILPIDGISNFNDCDFWLMISDRTFSPLAPVKDYGMIIYDYIQRYIPGIFDPGYYEAGFIDSARNAKFVLTTTPGTYNDITGYAGVSQHKTYLMPFEFNPFYRNPQRVALQDNYFIWTTNLTHHKNHLKAIDALEIYYGELDGTFKVVVTGCGTHMLEESCTDDIGDYPNGVRQKIAGTFFAKKHLKFLGNLSLQLYVDFLAAAKFLWHPTIYDNGTYCVIEAAYYGVPSVSSNYPQMKFIDELFKLNMVFFDSHNSREMAMQLKNMEQNFISHRQKLPDKAYLEQFTYKKIASEFWSLFRSLM